MSSIAFQLTELVQTIQQNKPLLAMVFGSLWLIHIVNALISYRLNQLGLYPRNAFGLIGIFASPFLHGNFNHVFFNSIPLFILMVFLLQQGLALFYITTGLIVLGSGMAVWLLGRKALHIGASSLIMGYWGYLIIDAYIHPSTTSVLLILLCLYYFGGFLTSLIPSEGTSWEGHVFGLISGMLIGYFHISQLVLTWILSRI